MPEETLLLIKTASEIAIKSHFVRNYFTKKLIKNIKNSLKAKGIKAEKIIRGQGFLLLYTEKGQETIKLLEKIFGIHSIAKTKESYVEDMIDIKQAVFSYAKKFLLPGEGFALRVSREGEHSFSSRDIAVQCGKKIMDSIPGLKVDLSKPKKELFIELHEKQLLLYSKKISGPKGLPVGVEGKAAVLFNGTKDDFTASILMMKRGCRITALIEKKNPKINRTLKKLLEWNSFKPIKTIFWNELRKDNRIKALVLPLTKLNNKTLQEIASIKNKSNTMVLEPALFCSHI
ncbi:MAG: THUMP domain-containing protein [Candidatus Diapherotrites archaeon]